jgi:uncharacterized protein (AIM24 family)
MTDHAGALAALQELEVAELATYADDVAIHGTIAQFLTLGLKRGQAIWCSRGSLLAYNDKVKWELKIPGGAGKAMSRMLAGEGVSLTYVTAEAPGAKVVLTNNAPGRLLTWDLDRGPITCTSGSFVAALGDVAIDVTIARKAGAAFFGGAGLFLQRLSGHGIAVVHGSGDFHLVELRAGEKLLVSTGNLAVFSSEMEYDVRGVGGCLKAVFGGEGLFMTELTGPGWVVLQSLKRVPIAAKTGR